MGHCLRFIFPDVLLPVVPIRVGVIGFHGGVKVVDKVPKPAFTMHVNGCDQLGEERFGDNWGVMLETDIPEFLVALGKKVSEAACPHGLVSRPFGRDAYLGGTYMA